MRRSEMLASSATAIARKSLMKPIGSAWKLPPERMSSPKISGLSDTPFTAAAEHLARVVERVLDGPEYLRHAAHRVRDPARARSPRGCFRISLSVSS